MISVALEIPVVKKGQFDAYKTVDMVRAFVYNGRGRKGGFIFTGRHKPRTI